MPAETTTSGFMALHAESGKPIQLAMQQLWLQGKILPVGARLMVRHVFRSSESKPLEVIYAFAMPRDAALRQFIITGEGFRVRSRLKPTEEAVKEYEAGIQAGHLATLARQYGDGMVNLTVGNIRPRKLWWCCSKFWRAWKPATRGCASGSPLRWRLLTMRGLALWKLSRAWAKSNYPRRSLMT